MLISKDPKTHFDAKYRASNDPWLVGELNTNTTYRSILEVVGRLQPDNFENILDIGCGTGHLTRAFKTMANTATGVDISETAVATAKQMSNEDDLHFHAWDVRDPVPEAVQKENGYDLIVCSEVLYYYSPEAITDILENLQSLLSDGGQLFLIHSTDGPRYQVETLINFLLPHFAVLESGWITNHAYIVATTTQPCLALTLDYEAREHAPESKRNGKPDLKPELIEPTQFLLDVASQCSARLTFFVEVAQIQFWEQFDPSIADQMKDQIRAAYQLGHDVQLHLHPRWLPEFGAKYDAASDTVTWNMEKGHLAAFDEPTLRKVLHNADACLRNIISPIDSHYRPSVFRAGKYQIAPHKLVFEILSEIGYVADSSVYQGGYVKSHGGTPGFDYTNLWTTHQPFWPHVDDINQPGEGEQRAAILEFPIASNGNQLSLDRSEPSEFRNLLNSCDQFSVAIGHPKDHGTRAARNRVETIIRDVSKTHALVGMRLLCAAYLSQRSSSDDAYQTQAAQDYYQKVLPTVEHINLKLNAYNRRKLNHATELLKEASTNHHHLRVLDYGCGTGELFTIPLASNLKELANVEISGYDLDAASIFRGNIHVKRDQLNRLRFTSDRSELQDGSFDVITCLEVLEHVNEPEQLVNDMSRLLRPGGVLYLTIPNGYGPKEYESALQTRLQGFIMKHPSLLRFCIACKRGISKKSQQSTSDVLPISETANVANNFHVQFFRNHEIPSVAEETGLHLQRSGNTSFLHGLSAVALNRLPPFKSLNAWLTERVPAPLASGWWYEFEKEAA